MTLLPFLPRMLHLNCDAGGRAGLLRRLDDLEFVLNVAGFFDFSDVLDAPELSSAEFDDFTTLLWRSGQADALDASARKVDSVQSFEAGNHEPSLDHGALAA